jgi:hypothetical protein
MGTGTFITIKTTTYPHELLIIKSLLDAEGIEYFVKNENFVQTIPSLSNATGGVELQVYESDVEAALAILHSTGYLPTQNLPKPKYRAVFDNITQKIPLVKKLPVELRLYALIAIAIIILVPTVVLLQQPTTYETLINNTWCVDEVSYEGKTYIPYTLGIRFEGAGFCNEEIELDENGYTRLPGFQSMGVNATWQYNNDRLCLRADTFTHVYNKCFEVDIFSNGRQLILSNGTTQIHCHQQRINIHLPF